jgi:hypothetical protein
LLILASDSVAFLDADVCSKDTPVHWDDLSDMEVYLNMELEIPVRPATYIETEEYKAVNGVMSQKTELYSSHHPIVSD